MSSGDCIRHKNDQIVPSKAYITDQYHLDDEEQLSLYLFVTGNFLVIGNAEIDILLYI